MNVIHGRDAYIEFYKNDEYRPFICCESVEISVSTETKQVKTVGDGIWSRVRGQKNSYSITVSGIVPYGEDDVNAFDLLEYQMSMTGILYRMIFKQNDGTTLTMITGEVLVTGTTLTSPVDFLNASLTFQGVGPFELGIPPSCSAEISDYDVEQDEFSYALYHVAINSLVSGTVPRYDYSIDGGEDQTALSTGWTFNVSGLPGAGLGDHVLEIWPVCANGVKGVKETYNFTTSFF
jgi:hypothetical protein